MLMKRLYDREGFDPDAHLALRGEVARLQADLKRATSKAEAERIQGELKVARDKLKEATPTVVGVAVKSTGATERQNFSPSLIGRGQKEGWLERKGDTFVIHSHAESIPDPEKPAERTLTHEGDLVFKIEREPGYYCCICGEPLEDDGGQADEDGLTLGARHVAEEHPGATSPDPNNPAGYCRINHFETVLTDSAGKPSESTVDAVKKLSKGGSK